VTDPVSETPSGPPSLDPTATPAAPGEPDSTQPAGEQPADEQPAATAAPRRRRRWPWLLLLALLALAAAAWYWQQLTPAEPVLAEAGPPPWQQGLDAAASARQALASELGQLRDRQRALEQRLTDLGASNRVLREELLGMAERAAMLEQALARQVQTRREGAQALRLDEIEFLLQLAAERLQLFADPDAALRAMQLADDSLEHLREPMFAGLRQTLAQEIALLRSLPQDHRGQLRAELSALQRILPQLPQRGNEVDDSDAEPSRLRELLDSLITVRRLDEAGAALTPIERATRAGALQLQLGLAQMALETADAEAWQAALGQALVLFDGLYADAAASTRQARQRLEALQASSPALPMPVLGSALRELRNLRQTRQFGRAAADADERSPPAANAPDQVPAARPAAPAEHGDAPELEVEVEVE
jgi:uroporphyrin-III C-methyltransferase